ncbi:conserved hypothetical protein [Arcobacter nitrofigilis DSM 7299]|uniref:Uncharacterized protein n=1 Tax=Arcobacter nitrofigilis (strain ATCC 33309 / DSM 7299 / CCUG 15893 / LMG 7604 / NCTC 12251 / CI) TaxID=572480 RepID=D5V633_ARCNC|nr:hypothetical protein [Arcobacter nitrofigilis]ADG93200.1 conserved hypothetical protein [Arcobacter nitrofigilis DSM 7299]
MKMQGLSLDQAPPYKIPMIYYIIASFYLLGFCLCMFIYASGIENRYYYEAIAITHIFTLGFFTHVMIGSLFQMIPVIIGVAYKKVNFQAIFVLLFLNVGIICFIIGFLFYIKIFMHIASLFLMIALIFFAVNTFFTILKTEDKNPTVKTFLLALSFLFLGVIFGIITLVNHGSGFTSKNFADIHISTIFFGWLIMLISGVSYKVVPMFYVTKEYPLFIKNHFYWIVSLILVLLSSFIFADSTLIPIFKTLLAILTLTFSLTTIYLLIGRKRPRRDTTIELWYFSMINLSFASILWIINIYTKIDLDFILAIVFGLGFAYSIINGMLYKIVPFLTWFHLSSKMIFDAEMSQVIQNKYMKLQYNIFIVSYFMFLLSLLFKSLIYLAIVLFFISSLILSYNIISAYKYYKRLDKTI